MRGRRRQSSTVGLLSWSCKGWPRFWFEMKFPRGSRRGDCLLAGRRAGDVQLPGRGGDARHCPLPGSPSLRQNGAPNCSGARLALDSSRPRPAVPVEASALRARDRPLRIGHPAWSITKRRGLSKSRSPAVARSAFWLKPADPSAAKPSPRAFALAWGVGSRDPEGSFRQNSVVAWGTQVMAPFPAGHSENR